MKPTSHQRVPPIHVLLWHLARYRLGLYLLNGLLWTAIHLFPLVPGLILQAFFDTLTHSAPAGLDVVSLSALLPAATLAQAFAVWLGVRLDTLHRFTISGLVRRNLLAGLLARPGARTLDRAPGEVLTYFREDAQQLEDALSLALDVFGAGVFALCALVILLNINAFVTLGVFIPLALIIFGARQAGEHLQRTRRVSRRTTENVTGLLGELFDAVQAIQIAGAEAHVARRLATLNAARRTAALQDRVLTEGINAVARNTVDLGAGLILLLAAGALRDHTFTVGDFALFVHYLSFVSGFTQALGHFLAHYKQTGVAFERLHDLVPELEGTALVAPHRLNLMRTPPPPPPPPTKPTEPLRTLRVRGLTCRHPERAHLISEVSFTLARGTHTVITGRVGAGKSTLLRALLGLLPRDAGEIYWNDIRVDDPAEFFVPPRSAYTPQSPALFSGSLRDNILLGLPGHTVDLPAALYQAVFELDTAGFRAGLHTPVGMHGMRLSGGQVQRAAAARMFVRRPDLLVFDDLSSALDADTERTLWARLSADPDMTCLSVSHSRAVLEAADQLIVLKEGRVVGYGPFHTILPYCEELQRLLQNL